MFMAMAPGERCCESGVLSMVLEREGRQIGVPTVLGSYTAIG